MIKNTQKYILIIFVILIICIVVVYLKNNDNKPDNVSREVLSGSDMVHKKVDDRNKILSDKYKCEFTSNLEWTQCVFDVGDRASAEREWKQRKLESLNKNQVNVEDMSVNLEAEQAKIRRWREGFESARDSWCYAENGFSFGSMTPGMIAGCRLNKEIEAIKIVNSLYYETMVGFGGSGEIKDFEPTEVDIDKLVKINKTKVICEWTGEGNCN